MARLQVRTTRSRQLFAIQSNRPPNKDFAEIRGSQIVYLKPLADQDRVTTAIQGFSDKAADYDVRVENKKAGVGVSIKGDRPLQSEALWSIRAVLAVEPFVHISAAPGKEFTWTMTYNYYPVAEAGNAAFEKICTTCHDADQAVNTKRTKAEWEHVVDDMVTKGANGSDKEMESIIAYLTKSYGKN